MTRGFAALHSAAPLDVEVCERARHARDPRFDGRFFIAVRTTGVYCRPICPVRPPRPENVRFYASAAAAAEAGFRPCLRCRPESSPGAPVWAGTSTTVARALRLIDDGALDGATVEALAARLGVGARHLGRLFVQHLGATPVQVAQNRRRHLAKKLLDETDLAMIDVAHAAGFSSVRRFNEAMRAGYGRTPSAIRRGRRGAARGTGIRLRLSFRPPLDWPALRDFLALRAVAGVEHVSLDRYERTIAIAGQLGRIAVSPLAGRNELELAVDFADAAALAAIAARARRMFDLNADPLTIEGDLEQDEALGERVRAAPGLRVPGAWDGFELAVRAILGQGVTVKGARTLAGRLVARLGEPLPGEPSGTCGIAFPTARALAAADLTGLGLLPARAAALRTLARRAQDGEIDLDTPRDPSSFREALQSQPGIGAWTADYIALRALGEPDAFPAADLGLLRGAELVLGLAPGSLTPAALERRAERWRPWRGYAALHLWRAYASAATKTEARNSGRISGLRKQA